MKINWLYSNGQWLDQTTRDWIASACQEFGWSRELTMSDFKSDHHRYFVGLSDGQPLAFVGFRALFGEWEVHSVYVHPDFRGRGFGKTLLSEFVAQATHHPVEMIYLEVREQNLVAQAIYQTVGFTIVDRRLNYYKDPVDHALLMQYHVPRKEDHHDTHFSD